MKQHLFEASERYAASLREFVSGGGEEALRRAYEIGRQFLEAGGGVLELADLHHEALARIGSTNFDAAAAFLREALSPFEMTHRGYRDTAILLRKRAAELSVALRELREGEARFRAVAETAQDAIISADSRGRIVCFNHAAQRIFGYAPEEALGQPLTVLMPDRYHEKHQAGIRRYLETGQSRIIGSTVELAGRRKDGSEFPAEISLATWKAHGNPYFTAIIRDVTERRQAAEERDRLSTQLLQGQKLQAIGQLAAGVAHEINNPVSYILSNVITLHDYFADLSRLLLTTQSAVDRVASGEDPARVREDLDRIREEIQADFLLEDLRSALRDCREGAERIRDIVRSLKDFAHPDEGQLREADLHKGIESTIRVCWNELKYKAEVHLDLGELPPLLCQPQRLNQVFVNLLLNAAQAIPEKGDIFVSTRREGDWAVVRIRDTGMGIPARNLPRLFEPFFTTKPVGKGTGLGLHVAYKVVEAHGGNIEVRSEEGKGTEFTIRLPIRPKA